MRLLRPLPALCLALAPFAGAQEPFAAAATRALRARAGLDTLRVLHLGDSHTGARAFAAAWRACLQAQFGEGGTTLLPWLAPAGPRTGRSPGWRVQTPRLAIAGDGLAGPGGAWLEADRPGERAWVEAPFRRLRLHLLRRPGGGRARILVDGRELARVDLEGPVGALCLEPDLAGEARRLEVECLGGPVRVLAAALENGPGVSWGALGVIGAQAGWLLRSDPALFAEVLRREAPDLVVLAFGTNEASLGDFDAEAYRRTLQALIERVRSAVPGAALVLLGPPDAVLPRSRPGALEAVARVQAELARSSGALFVSQAEAMGGAGSMDAWARQGLALKDRVHLAPEGYSRLARAGAAALLARLERAAGPGDDPRLARVRPGAFTLPAQAPRLLGRLESPVPDPAPAARPIYTFRHADGRLLVTDDPSKVEGLPGSWVGRGPR